MAGVLQFGIQEDLGSARAIPGLVEEPRAIGVWNEAHPKARLAVGPLWL